MNAPAKGITFETLRPGLSARYSTSSSQKAWHMWVMFCHTQVSMFLERQGLLHRVAVQEEWSIGADHALVDGGGVQALHLGPAQLRPPVRSRVRNHPALQQ